MILLNFSHPITPEQIERIEQLTGRQVEQVVDLPVQFDNDVSFIPQLEALIARVPLSAAEYQVAPLLVNLPALNFIAALLLAELHGRMGYFPAVMRTRPLPESLPPRYEVAEILNLQAVRERARAARGGRNGDGRE
jgi:hypothetical protein